MNLVIKKKEIKCFFRIVFLFLIISETALGQFQLLKDISNIEGVASSNPTGMIQLGDHFYFAASDNVHGAELWKSDGTENGTMLFFDIHTGKNSSNPSSFIVFEDKMYFQANDGKHGPELWVTDGTIPGTHIIKDINPGLFSSNPTDFIQSGGIIFFKAHDNINGEELWKTNGTEEGTILVKDIYMGVKESHITIYKEGKTNDGVIYFRADDGEHGREVWKSDGTNSGTILLKDIRQGSLDSSPADILVMGDNVFFVASDGIHNRELWKSDGTEEGTLMLKDIRTGGGSSSILDIMEFQGVLYFGARDDHGRNLWRSDGTQEGTYSLTNSSVLKPFRITEASGNLFFAGGVGSSDYELWKSDGTEEGTVLVKEINPTGGAFTGITTEREYFISTSAGTFFDAENGNTGKELWITNGTDNGTFLVKDIFSGPESSNPSHFITFNDKLYFTADNGLDGHELWQSDGTEQGTFLVKKINMGGGSADPREFARMGDITFFDADDGVHGRELWKTDGTEIGTIMVKDINPNTASSSPENFMEHSGYLYFTAQDGVKGVELWKTDGTEEGTIMVKDIFDGSRESNPTRLFDATDALYFVAENGISGLELWKTDGTSDGTVLVKDINASGSSFSTYYDLSYRFVEMSEILYFEADDGIHGAELWRSDGTENGTYMVKDIEPTNSSTARWLIEYSGFLYFSSTDNTNGTELWKSDGTEEGTVLLKDIYQNGYGNPGELTIMGSELYFSATDGTHGDELWKSDGTAEGTVLVKNINPGNGYSRPSLLLSSSEILYFQASDDTHGRELWKSDGTAEGTVMVKDINEGYESTGLLFLTEINGNLYFRATDRIHGTGVWCTNGSLEGTQILEFAEGVNAPGMIFHNNGLLFTDANSTEFSREIFTHKVKSFQSINFPSISEKTYGDAPITLTASASSANTVTFSSSDEDIAKVMANEVSIVGAGSITIIAEQEGDELYYPIKTERSFIVHKATLSAQVISLDRKYGDSNPQPDIEFEGFKNDDNIESLDTAPIFHIDANTGSDVGKYEITLEIGEDNNYEITEVLPGTLTIVKSDLIASSEQTRKYGQDNEEFVISYSGFKNNDDENDLDELPLASSQADKTSVSGQYDISLTNVVDNNYNVISNTGTLTIDKATLTATVENESRIYGGSNPDFNISYEGFVNDESVDDLDNVVQATTTANQKSPVGEYDVNITEVIDANYEIEEISGTLTVSKATLSAKAEDAERTYGNDNPDFAISYIGFVNDDTIEDIDVVPSAQSSANNQSSTGEYEITLSEGLDNNYEITSSTGTLTISRATLNATADDKEKVYGQDNPDFTITYDGFLNGDTKQDLDALPIAESLASSESSVGEYDISLNQGEDNNYDINTTSGTLTITKAQLQATADNKNKKYGEDNPDLTVSYEGFVNNDSVHDLDALPTAQTEANEQSSVGEYEISLTDVVDSNYQLESILGVLTINKAELVATADNQTKKQGEPNPILTISYTGFVNGDDSSSIVEPEVSTSADEESSPGEYDILLIGGSSENYTISLVNGTLSILEILEINESLREDIVIYPNPTTNFLKASIFSEAQIRILSLEGKMVLSRRISKNQLIDLSTLHPGVYLIEIYNPQEILYKGKLIKE